MKFFLGASFVFSLFKCKHYRKKEQFSVLNKDFLKQAIKLLQFNLAFMHRYFTVGLQHLRKKKSSFN